jgi:hypothetical protein
MVNGEKMQVTGCKVQVTGKYFQNSKSGFALKPAT